MDLVDINGFVHLVIDMNQLMMTMRKQIEITGEPSLWENYDVAYNCEQIVVDRFDLPNLNRFVAAQKSTWTPATTRSNQNENPASMETTAGELVLS